MKMTHLFSYNNIASTIRLFLICCLCTLCSIQSLHATHIVGGSMHYNCLGDNIYEIILTVKRDCNLGADDAQFDDPAHIGIYNINGQLLDYLAYDGQLLLDFQGDENLQNEIQQICFSGANEICVHSTQYKGTVELSPNSNGYILAYQRCCRNSSLNNVVSPLQTGMTLTVEISRDALQVCNSSPSFDQSPDIFICEGDVLEFDGSATDADGDELRYSLCTPYSGASEDWPQPKPANPPPYEHIEWVEGFGAANPLGVNIANFDEQTGMFTIRPESTGQFLVGMCVEEYRDGELLSVTTREFQYNVVRCSNEIVSDFEVQQNGCSLDGVQFTNQTPDADEYTWFFNYPSTDPAFISNDPNPVFNYSEAGTYTVRLVTNSNGTVCESIIDKHVTISNTASTQIQSSILFCDGNKYTFRITDPVADRTQRQWLINVNGQQQTASSQFVDFEVNRDDNVEIELNATSATGCVETQTLNFIANLIDFTTEVVSCSAEPNRIRVVLTPSPIEGLIDNPIVSYEWSATNGATAVQTSDELLELDVNFNDKLWVGLTVVFENGCTAEVERNILPHGTIFESPEIETEAGSTITFFNNDQIIINLFDNPNSEPLNEEIVRKEWIILSPSQGEIRGEGSSINYTSDRNETIDVIYRFTTASGCIFEIKKTYTFANADLCKGLGPDDDICTILTDDPSNPLADLDCDGDGISNILECNNGSDPNNPNDACIAVINGELDICLLLQNDPNSELAGLDCDNDGIDNATECENGSDPNNPDDACDIAINGNGEICEILANDPGNPLATLDCDNDGVDNITECNNGTDPTDPLDACVAVQQGNLDICALLSQNPNSALATFDCDGDGIDNISECQNGGNPSDPNDACVSITNGNLDVCGILNVHPDSPVGALDCDGDGFNNADECVAGSDPNNGCDIPDGQSYDICAILASNPDSPLANEDCDNGGIDNITECQNGGNPLDPNDECIAIQNAGIDICTFLSNNPDSPIADLDCDNDGVDNGTECSSGTNPVDPSDGCIALQNAGINICTFLNENPDSPVATLDCDGDGVDNQTECNNGTDPNDREDACEAFLLSGIDLCSFLSENPDHPVADFDCDEDGIDNGTECMNGTDPFDANNACMMLEADADICRLLATNPSTELANADCDGDGFSNLDECSGGSDPADGCSIPEGETIDICAILAADPDSPLGLFDCDNGGINNAIECRNDGNPNDPTDECISAYDPAVDICTILQNDPNSPLAALDCDGDGFTNADECNRGSDPTDGCDFPGDDAIDICAILAADPNSPLGMFDCDGDGFTNLDECNRGSDPDDGCDIPEGESIDICAILAADPDSPLGMFDCDNGGIDNATECENGGNPNDPNDECISAYDDSVDVCAILAENPDSTLGDLDCDGDGFTNAEECNAGSDPVDGCDIPEGETIDICAILEADPDSPIGMFDCDNGGIDNATECENGGDPNDPSDECLSAYDDSVDICAILAADPDSPLGDLDCDGDGFTNAEECSAGSDPVDGCDIPDGETIDICAILEADPDSPIGMFDCDNGGIDNETECENGNDPNDPSDECDSITDEFDICAFLAENPDSPLGALDCDGDGVDNATECENGSDPLDPNDNCPTGVSIDIGDGLGIPAVICAGVDTPISVTVDSQDSLFFEWGPTDCIISGGMTTSPIINATGDKQLQLRVLNETIGCESTIDVPLDISDPSVGLEVNLPDPVTIGDNLEVFAVTEATDPVYNWNSGENTESIEDIYDETETYIVTITDAFGCMATDSITIVVDDASCDSDGIFLPNSFSPNGDNLNDVLFVRSNAIQTLEFSIFDRWGREVFKSNSLDVGWNGRWQNDGDELAPDAYAYWIKATCFSGEEFVQQGNVSILR